MGPLGVQEMVFIFFLAADLIRPQEDAGTGRLHRKSLDRVPPRPERTEVHVRTGMKTLETGNGIR